jgi:hypothetical protein
MQMKVSFLLALMVLIGFSAVPAMADGGVTDPTAIVNGHGDPTCTDGSAPDGAVCFSANSQADPLFTPSFNPANFVWDPADGTDTLTTLFIEFPFVPGEIYGCASNIFATCGSVGPVLPVSNQGTNLEFEFANGSIAANEEFSAGVSPEPETLLLMGTGLISLLAFRRKKAI